MGKAQRWQQQEKPKIKVQDYSIAVSHFNLNYCIFTNCVFSVLGSSLRKEEQNLVQALTYPKHCGSNFRKENKY